MRRPVRALVAIASLFVLATPVWAQAGASSSQDVRVIDDGAIGGVGPGRETPPGVPAATVRVPKDAPTIQGAVDRAEPGGLVLISPGVYHEAVVVETPFLTIRGTNRNEVILDGGFELDNAIQVIEADGVSIENLTATTC